MRPSLAGKISPSPSRGDDRPHNQVGAVAIQGSPRRCRSRAPASMLEPDAMPRRTSFTSARVIGGARNVHDNTVMFLRRSRSSPRTTIFVRPRTRSMSRPAEYCRCLPRPPVLTSSNLGPRQRHYPLSPAVQIEFDIITDELASLSTGVCWPVGQRRLLRLVR